MSKLVTTPSKSKLFNQLITIFLALSILPCVLLTTISTQTANTTLENTLTTYSEKIIDQLLYNIDYFVNNTKIVMAGLSVDPSIIQYTSQYDSLSPEEKTSLKIYLNNKSTNVTSNYNIIKNISLLNNNSIVYTTLIDSTNFENLLQKEDFKAEITNLAPSTFICYGSTDYNTPSIYAIIKPQGAAHCAIVCELDTQVFTELINLATIQSIPIMICDTEGHIILSDTPNLIGTNALELNPDYIPLLDSLMENPSIFANRTHLTSMAKLGNDWSIIIDAPLSILKSTYTKALQLIALLLVLVLFISLAISFAFSKKLVHPIKTIVTSMQKMQEGNLESEEVLQKQVIPSNAETNLLLQGFISLLHSLKTLISQAKTTTNLLKNHSIDLNNVAEHTASTAKEVERSIHLVAEGAQNCTAQVEESLAKIDLLSENINTVMDQMKNIQASSSSTITISTNANKNLDFLSSQSESTLNISLQINHEIQTLSLEINQINNILNIIKYINSQTNLLSLNAAIEAARAGEAGKGFGVVAKDIRNLSTQTQEAISTIDSILVKINSQKETTLSEVDKAVAFFNAQAPIVNKVIRTFEEINTHMQAIDDEIHSTYSTLDTVFEQKEDLLSRIQEITTIVEQQATIAEEVTAASMQQTEEASEIHKMVDSLTSNINSLQETYSKFN